MSTDPNTLLEHLLSADLLRAEPGEEQMWLTKSFRRAIEAERETLGTERAIRRRLSKYIEDERQADALVEVALDDAEFVAKLLVVADRLKGLSNADHIRTSVVLDQLSLTSPPSSGAPHYFLPVHGDRLPTLLRVCQPAVVYVWREDCDPCDTMRQELEQLLAERDDDIGLFAVYGPDSATFLFEEYDVIGAPTLLFMTEERVDSRLQGAQYRDVIAAEIAQLERSAG